MNTLLGFTSDIQEIGSACVAAKQAEDTQTVKALGAERKQRVLRHIEANPNYPIRRLVKKFGLDWSLEKNFNNGVSRVGFYTGEDNLTLIMELYLPTAEWFRS